MDFEPASILVELDALFDTRLATLVQLDESKIDVLLTEGQYDLRNYDEFLGYDTDTFNKAYAKRDINTLRESLITQVPVLINFFVGKTLTALVGTPFRRQPRVVLNIYPYKLDPQSEATLIKGLAVVTKNNADIQIISMNYEELTPSYVKENFVAMIMYSYWEWLETHSQNKNLLETQCPLVRLYAPMLVRSSDAWKQLKGVDVYDAIETYTGPFIKLELQPSSMFSIDLARYVESKKKKAEQE